MMIVLISDNVYSSEQVQFLISPLGPHKGKDQARRGLPVELHLRRHLTQRNRAAIQGREAASAASRVRLQIAGKAQSPQTLPQLLRTRDSQHHSFVL
jgi:hypothetical protein